MPRTPPPLRADFPAFVPLQTRWNDNDEYGHLNNATYFELFDTAITYWQMENGINVRGPDAWRFVVVENGCTYFREVGFPDALSAGLRIARLGGSSYRIEVGLFREGEEEAASLGFFVNVLTGADTRPTPIPGDLRARLSRIAVPEAAGG
ncbi:Thioesterase superfamily protein [Roseivivax sp. THAF40]|uniref:acyl-CoA thioesterase n=1 Tax=unclassified Roseivivax TaxID=2639302 RepID=UPI0012696583|nr:MULTISPECIES: thioesterase family protein [unclassified Roseivivax]QFS84116.1 Thioesterase superfamily protein [Roseivivax sp. THAF197b]QFT47943.1 Thioesterase superfamily protein [Roseivivax sp. THAF40]